MYSLRIITEEDKDRIKGMFHNFVKNHNMTKDRAIERILEVVDFRLDIQDKILYEIWVCRNYKQEIENGRVFYPNDRNAILDTIADEMGKRVRYLVNIFYQLRHDNLIETKVVIHNRRRYTLCTLTDDGMYHIGFMLSRIKACVEHQ